MTKALFYIQLGTKEEISFGHPFGSLPGWLVYDLDNHADAVTLQYARRLLDETREVVLVFEQHGIYDSLGSVAGFLEGVMRSKKARPVAYLLGPVTLPLLISKRFEMQEMNIVGIKALLGESFEQPQDPSTAS